MKIEIVEYYPEISSLERGTLHIYYVDKGMDIRGIICFKLNGKWRINLPNGWGKDPETKERTCYPIVAFVDENEHKELTRLIRKQGRAYIKEKLKSQNIE